MITVSYNYHAMTYFEDVSQENIIPLVPFWYLQLLFVKDELFFTCSIPILLNIFNFFSYVFLSPMCNFGYNFKTILDYFLQYAQIYFNYILFPYFFKARPNAINNILPGDKVIEFSSRFCSRQQRQQPSIFAEMFENWKFLCKKICRGLLSNLSLTDTDYNTFVHFHD